MMDIGEAHALGMSLTPLDAALQDIAPPKKVAGSVKTVVQLDYPVVFELKSISAVTVKLATYGDFIEISKESGVDAASLASLSNDDNEAFMAAAANRLTDLPVGGLKLLYMPDFIKVSGLIGEYLGGKPPTTDTC